VLFLGLFGDREAECVFYCFLLDFSDHERGEAFTNVIPSVAYTCDGLLRIWKPRVEV
jgi:hypothetical protein